MTEVGTGTIWQEKGVPGVGKLIDPGSQFACVKVVFDC